MEIPSWHIRLSRARLIDSYLSFSKQLLIGMELLNIFLRMEMVFDIYTWVHVCCRFSPMCKIGGNYFNSKMVSTNECWRQGSSIQYYFAIICHKSQNKDWARQIFGFENWTYMVTLFCFFKIDSLTKNSFIRLSLLNHLWHSFVWIITTRSLMGTNKIFKQLWFI